MGFIILNIGNLIHVLLVLAVASALIQIIKDNKE